MSHGTTPRDEISRQFSAQLNGTKLRTFIRPTSGVYNTAASHRGMTAAVSVLHADYLAPRHEAPPTSPGPDPLYSVLSDHLLHLSNHYRLGDAIMLALISARSAWTPHAARRLRLLRDRP